MIIKVNITIPNITYEDNIKGSLLTTSYMRASVTVCSGNIDTQCSEIEFFQEDMQDFWILLCLMKFSLAIPKPTWGRCVEAQ